VAESVPSAFPLPAQAFSAPSTLNPLWIRNSCGSMALHWLSRTSSADTSSLVFNHVTTARTSGRLPVGERSEQAAVGLPVSSALAESTRP
jgi:hypothetical protein